MSKIGRGDNMKDIIIEYKYKFNSRIVDVQPSPWDSLLDEDTDTLYTLKGLSKEEIYELIEKSFEDGKDYLLEAVKGQPFVPEEMKDGCMY